VGSWVCAASKVVELQYTVCGDEKVGVRRKGYGERMKVFLTMYFLSSGAVALLTASHRPIGWSAYD
jgi:hypothetical protein